MAPAIPTSINSTRTYATANSTSITEKPSRDRRLKRWNKMLEVRGFRENRTVRAINQSDAGGRSLKAETKNPANSASWRGIRTDQREFGQVLLAETEGFEPSMQVLPACSLSRGVPSTSRPRLRKGAMIAVSARPVKPKNQIIRTCRGRMPCAKRVPPTQDTFLR